MPKSLSQQVRLSDWVCMSVGTKGYLLVVDKKVLHELSRHQLTKKGKSHRHTAGRNGA